MRWMEPPYVREGDFAKVTICGTIVEMDDEAVKFKMPDGSEAHIGRTFISEISQATWIAREGDVYAVGGEVYMIKSDDDHLLYAHSSLDRDLSLDQIDFLLFPENLIHRSYKAENRS